jgi:hypothetical protein
VGKASRDKGKRGEREWAALLRERLGLEARRGIQSRGGGAEAADVVTALFHHECKVGQRPNLAAALEQAERDARPGVFPVAACRRDREAWTVTMRGDDWLELVRLWLAETGDLERAEAAVAGVCRDAGEAVERVQRAARERPRR